MHTFLKQLMLELGRKDEIKETLSTHIVKSFDIDAAPDAHSKTLLTSRTFMEPIVIFVRGKLDLELQQRKYGTALRRKSRPRL